MKFEAGKTYKTRCGSSAIIYCVDADGDFPIHGAIDGRSEDWDESGNYYGDGTHCTLDLMPPAPPRISQTVWVNVHKDGIVVCFTRDAANLTDPDFTIRHAVPCRLEEIVE